MGGEATVYGRLFMNQDEITTKVRKKWRLDIFNAINYEMKNCGREIFVHSGRDIRCEPKPVDRYVYVADAVVLFHCVYNSQNEYTSEEMMSFKQLHEYISDTKDPYVKRLLKSLCNELLTELDLLN